LQEKSEDVPSDESGDDVSSKELPSIVPKVPEMGIPQRKKWEKSESNLAVPGFQRSSKLRSSSLSSLPSLVHLDSLYDIKKDYICMIGTASGRLQFCDLRRAKLVSPPYTLGRMEGSLLNCRQLSKDKIEILLKNIDATRL